MAMAVEMLADSEKSMKMQWMSFDQNCRKLQPTNRVGITDFMMLPFAKGRFPELSPSEQDKVAGDLVKAVCQYWGGRSWPKTAIRTELGR
jgi:hypothetical protein